MLIEPIFRELAERMIQVMRDNITRKPIRRRTESKGQFEATVNASGNLANSLTYRIDGYVLEILAAEYWRNVVYGQEPGEIPDVQAVSNWLSIKGLSLNPQRVAMNIGYYGNSIFQEWQGENSGLFDEATDESILTDFNRQLANETIKSIQLAVNGTL